MTVARRFAAVRPPPELIEHCWSLTPAEARTLQQELAPYVVRKDLLDPVGTVGGIDIGFEDHGKTTRAAAVVLSFPGLELLEQSLVRCETRFPYVPGLLSFREAPAALEAWRQLRTPPDLLLCDGQGIAHPRRFGLACHLGLLLDVPTVGVAKSRYIGDYEEPGRQRGSRAPLKDGQEVLGSVLRTRTGVSPVFVSLGHRVNLDTAVRFVLACAPRYRLPETTRLADRIASGR